MTDSWKIGGVTLQVNEDGSFFIYQPDSNRALGKETAIQVADQIRIAYGEMVDAADLFPRIVPPPDGWVDQLTDTEVEADKNAQDARVQLDEMTAAAEADGSAETATEFVATRPAPVKRRPGRPRKAQP
jgi:hypothetical protein